MAYWRMALGLCRVFRVEPSLLLHPLDFLGAEDDADLAFFPAMGRPAAEKIELVGRVIDQLEKHYRLAPMAEHAREIQTRQPATKVQLSTVRVES
jgi:hypothetical protein